MRSVRPFAYASQVSRVALAVALVAAAPQVRAQVYNGFQGTPTVAFGAGVTAAQGGQIDLGTAPKATINWVPDDHATGSGAINFLPNTYSQTFTGSGSGPQTVLNRILPTDATRAIALNGVINNANSINPNIRVWIYNAGGILVGSTASINVGGLVLTTADPSPNGDATADYMPVQDRFTLTGTSGSTAKIEIDSSAHITANSSYILAFAPQIIQNGTITAANSAALVAGESATFAIDPNGLFNIAVTTGSSVTGSPLVDQEGTITGTGSPGSKRRIYLMAMPRNDAVAMVVAAGGSLGFVPAQNAEVDDDAIVLSAGQPINDIANGGVGNPVSGPSTQASVALAGSTPWTSQVYAGSTVAVTADTVLSAGLSISADDLASGAAGHAQLNVIGHSLTVGGLTSVSADGSFQNYFQQFPPFSGAQAGTANVNVNGGSLSTAGLSVTANAAGQYSGSTTSQAAKGGTATVNVTSGSINMADSTSMMVSANGAGGDGNAGGVGTGGTASVQVGTGGQINFNLGQTGGGSLNIVADATGGFGFSGDGGSAVGGRASLITTDSGSINAPLVNSVIIGATASGGGASGASGGNAVGGTALLRADGSISIQTNGGGSILVDAHAEAASGTDSGIGGNGTGGVAQITVAGTAYLDTPDGYLSLAAQARGGDADQNPGTATGGATQISVANTGTLTSTDNTTLQVGTVAGRDTNSSPANSTGGTILVQNAGTLNLDTAGDNIQIDSSGATLGYTLISTTPSGRTTFGSGQTAAAGDIVINDRVIIGDADPVRISAAGNLKIPGSLVSGFDDHIDLIADNTGTGTGVGNGPGTVTLAPGAVSISPGSSVNIYSNPIGGFGTPDNFSAGVTGGGTLTSFQLINDVDHLQQINNFLDQKFALSRDIDATATQAWNGNTGFIPIGSDSTPFTGMLDGLNHQINGLVIQPQPYYMGLFGVIGSGAAISNLTLARVTINAPNSYYAGGLAGAALIYSGNASISNVAVTGSTIGVAGTIGGLIALSNGNGLVIQDSRATDNVMTATSGSVGGLVGISQGLITRSFATGQIISSGGSVGGLVGVNSGTITDSYATTSITASSGSYEIGGFAGANYGTLNRVYATGAINVGTGSQEIGGLVGLNSGAITEGLASGTLTAPGATLIGGIVGNARDSGSQVQKSYWDTSTTGQAGNPIQGSYANQVSNLVSVNSGNAYSAGSYSNLTPGAWIFVGGNTRPIGAWEAPVAQFGVATISSAHQVQLIDLNLAGNYAITQNIDMSGTQGLSDIWGSRGFQPIGQTGANAVSFTGTLAGQSHSLLNLRINDTASNGFGTSYGAGLISDNAGTISNLGLYNISVTTPQGELAGGFAAINEGTITGSYVGGPANGTGSISGGFSGAGGLVGDNEGSIVNSYATIAVSGGGGPVGGLAGDNSGTIDLSYATGAVGNGGGGLVGHMNAGAVTRSYWNTQSSGSSAGCASSSGGNCAGAFGLTTAQMMSASSFVGWDIVPANGARKTWRIYEGQTAPLLTSFLQVATSQVINAAVTYNGTVQGVPVTIVGADPSRIYGTPTFAGNGRRNATTAQNPYTVSYTGGLYSDQLGYDIVASSQTATLTINPAALSLSAVADSRSYNATTSSAGQVQTAGLVGGDTIGSLTQTFATPNAGGQALSVANTYIISDGNGGGNYTVTLHQAPGTITKAALTLAATSNGKSYDATTASSGAVQAIGLQGNDSVTGAIEAYDSANAGNRTLTVATGYTVNDGNSGGNYTVMLQSASGVISKAALTLAAVTDSRTYNATTGSAGQVQISGLKGNDSISGLSQAFDSANAGNRTLNVANGYTISDGNGGGNYAVSTTGASGTIGKAALTLAAATGSKTYDATTGSAAQVQATGLKGSDTVTGLAEVYDSANAGARTLSVATGYTINDGNGGGNYTVSTTGASGTIGKAALTLAAVTDTKTYDATTGSTAKVQATGLKGSDTVSGLTQTFDSANAGSRTLAVGGGYTVADGNGGGNYSVTLATATGTITPASLTVTYTANTASSIYGNAIGALSGSYRATGLLGNDTQASSTSGTAVFGTSANATSAVGSYAVSGSGISSTGNYQVTAVQAAGNGNALTITARPITVTADPQSRAQGFANPALTYTVAGSNGQAGLVNGDQLAGALGTSATSSSPAGDYAITQGTLAASNNYTLAYVGANLTVQTAITLAQLQQTAPDAAQTITSVAPNVTSQADATPPTPPTSQEQKEEQKAVGGSTKPAAVRAILINDGTVAIPQPVDEDVTSNGSNGLWAPR